MGAACCEHDHTHDNGRGGAPDPRFRRVLWAALAINATMFVVEIGAGLAAGSVSLQADALDFLGDAGNYAISLFVLGMAISYRARAAFFKGATMGVLGLYVLGATSYHALAGTLPSAVAMGSVGFVALTANLAVFAMLWRFRAGDSNMRSVWLCTRNDVIGNIAVLLAAFGVFGSAAAWPDLIVAAIMAVLGVQGAIAVMRHARDDLNLAKAPLAAE
ncbi:MAG: cation transporter [Rhodospirillaceae bacterium]|nr:cation transporter [Rhodospirillaceae bacterium]